MCPQGVYPSEDVCAVGDQISSTGEGRHVTLFPDNIEHGSQVSVVTKGYGVRFNQAVGMPLVTQTAATNLIEQGAIDTEGIWCVDVYARNDAGDSVVTPGQQLYMNTTTNLISKISDGATQICFGYALGNVTSGETNRIAVKVHFDPSMDNAKRTYYTVTSGTYTYGKHHTAIFAGGQSTGLEYFDQQVTGAQTGGIYGFGTWMELAVAFTPSGALIVAHEIGIYDAGCGLDTNGRVVMQQMAAILAATPATSFHWFRVNLAAAGGVATAVMAAANPNSVGYVADAVDNAGANKLGNVPLFDIVGVGVCYVEVFSS